MKNYLYTLFVLCCFGSIVNAQITLEIEDLPSADTEILVGNAGPGELDFGEASDQAQTWDFTTMQTFVVNPLQYQNPSDLDGNEDYPNSTVARTGELLDVLGPSLGNLIPLPIDLPQANAFYQPNGSGGLEFGGLFTNLLIPGILNGEEGTFDIDPTYQIFPSGTYGDVTTTDGATILLNAPIDPAVAELLGGADSLGLPDGIDLSAVDAGILVEIDSENTFDAFGTMNLPNDISHDVLRSTENLTVRLSVGAYIDIPIVGPLEVFNIIDTTINAIQTKFWAKGLGHPLISTLSLDAGIPTSLEYYYTPIPLQAGFDYVAADYNVSFTSTSTGDITDVVWDFGDGNTGTGDAVNHDFGGSGEFEVTVTVTDLLGETSSYTETIVVGDPVGLTALNETNINVYPNPVTDVLNVEINGVDIVQANLFDISGKLLLSQSINNTTQLNLADFASGLYLLVIKKDGEQFQQKVQVK